MSNEAQSLAKAADFLNAPGIEFTGDRVSGYEYKHWTPLWIPFIQASTGIWADDLTQYPNSDGSLPDSKVILPESSFDFQIFTPKDHPFLLIDIKMTACPVYLVGNDPAITTYGSRFKTPFDLVTQNRLYRKYLFSNMENVITSVIAVSPGGKPIWGGLQNTTGMINSVKTIGPEPHMERLDLSNSQSNRSGCGALKHRLLFPEDGIIKVTVENRNPLSASPPLSIDVNGVCFGYVLMR